MSASPGRTLAGVVALRETASMTMTYDQAVAVQRRHEGRILRLPGITGIGVKLHDGRPVLEVTVDPAHEVPAELNADELDGLPLVVQRRRYEPQ
jgi:hypothetical protein